MERRACSPGHDAAGVGGGRARTPVAPSVFSAARGRDRRGDPYRGGRRNAASLLQVLRDACALVCFPRRGGSRRHAAYPPPGEYVFHIFRVSRLCRPPVLGGGPTKPIVSNARQRILIIRVMTSP